MRLNLHLLSPLLLLIESSIGLEKGKESKEAKTSARLPACGSCTNLVNSFEAGMERTKKGKLDGGDTAWEEKSGQKYATSEVRLAEITEELCKGVDRGETQCHQLHGEWEDHLETWWGLEAESRPTLRQWLCVEKLKVCCVADTYGPECKPCSVLGENGKLCSGNGKCKGAGTRKGNGKCSCSREYMGDTCDQCSQGFYEAFRDESKLLCSACHKACAAHCSGPGPKACAKCAEGYQMNTEHGCMDIDECVLSKPCTKDKFCVNTEGTFRCMNCDKACNGCESDGPDNCVECAEGHQKNKNNVCVTDKMAGRVFTIDNTRFFTYAGLVVATCIIFHKHWVAASVIGGLVAVYISMTEYYLANNMMNGDLQPTPGTLDALQQSITS